MEDGDGDWRCRSSSKPFEAGSRGTLGRRFRAEKGGAQGGRYRGNKGEKVNCILIKDLLFVDGTHSLAIVKSVTIPCLD